MTGRYDDDGRLLVRQPDGDLMPEQEFVSRRMPDYPSDALCAEHGALGYHAATCPPCWSEIHAGERRIADLGRYIEVQP